MKRRTHLQYVFGGAIALTINPMAVWAKVHQSTSLSRDLGLSLEALTDIIVDVSDATATEINLWANFVHCFALDFVSPDQKELFFDGFQKLQFYCQNHFKTSFDQLNRESQKEVLQKLFIETNIDSFPKAQQWASQIRSYVLLAFYTSERGATKQLAYLPIPGKYEGELPLQPNQKAWTL